MTDASKKPSRALDTELIHHPYQPPQDFESVAPGVFKGSSIFFPNVAALRARRWIDKSAYTYGLHGTPTTFTLEERLATLEGGRHVVLVSSGLAAITLVDTAVLKAGDEVLLPDNVYGPSREFARHELAHWGITHRFYDPMDSSSLVAALSPATRLVWLEVPGSVTMEFPDLRALVRTAREASSNPLIALDNTWGAGIAFKPFDLGEGLAVDISVHALTKYPSGGGDLLMGSVTTVDSTLHQQLTLSRSRQGQGVAANDVETVLRSLPSLHLRYAAQDATGRRLAQWCQGRAEFKRVLHPAMPGAPGHEHWAALCSAAAGLFSVELDECCTQAQVDAFVDALKLFRIGWSWGGPVSLAVPYRAQSMRSLPVPYRGALVRFSAGLEAADDLIADLEQALQALKD